VLCVQQCGVSMIDSWLSDLCYTTTWRQVNRPRPCSVGGATNWTSLTNRFDRFVSFGREFFICYNSLSLLYQLWQCVFTQLLCISLDSVIYFTGSSAVAWCFMLLNILLIHSRLLKMVPFESLGTVSYLHFTVTYWVASLVYHTESGRGDDVLVWMLPQCLVWKTRMVLLPDGAKVWWYI